jgi:hypothetical protein
MPLLNESRDDVLEKHLDLNDMLFEPEVEYPDLELWDSADFEDFKFQILDI